MPTLSPVSPGAGLAPLATAESTGDDRARLTKAAAEFEALLLAQMLKSARESGSQGWMGGGEDHAAASVVELGEQQFAQALASQGGLGLAHLVLTGLSKTP